MINSRRARKRKRQHAPKPAAGEVVSKFDSQQPQARDEGPRLIPLSPSKRDHPFQSYLDLADIALNNKKTR
jgi:hypothetical protein